MNNMDEATKQNARKHGERLQRETLALGGPILDLEPLERAIQREDVEGVSKELQTLAAQKALYEKK